MDDEEAVDEYTETRECAVAARATANDSAKKDEPARTAIHFRVRQCAILVPMICILASASFTLFFLSDRSDDNRFREQYNRDAASLLHAASVDWIQACHAMSSLSVALTAQIIIQRNNNANTTNTTVTAGTPNNASWSPFVTLPSFPEQAASVRMLAGAVFVQVLPIVPPDRRAEWEAYVAATTTNTIQGEPYLESVGLATLNDVKANSPGRRRRAHRILSSDSNNSNVFQSPSNSTAESALLNASSSSSDSSSIRTRIFTLDASHVASANSEGSGYCAPMWQASPVNVDLVNFDFLSFQDQRAGIVAAFEKGQIGIGGMDLLWNSSLIMDPQFANRNSSLAPVVPREEDSLASSAPWNDTSRRLQSSLFFPVFNVHSVQTRTPVAVLHAIIDWTAFLKIPPLPDGFLVVLKNSQCGINNSSDRNQSFTFQSQWGALQMLGPGDQHDGSFDKYERLTELGPLIENRLWEELSLALDSTRCMYTAHVYPSDELRRSSSTNASALVAWTCVAIFMLTSTMCLIFSSCGRSAKNEAANLDEKGQGVDICDNYDYDDDDDDDGDDIMEEKLKLLKSPSKESATEEVSYTDQNSSFSSKRKTFVDDFDNCAASYHTTYSATYPNATVLFVDIYGFAAWSAIREPEAVFALLQTIYRRFDEIAKRFSVFKAESLGDSYVAVTGLPGSQPDHATLMARYALECLAQVRELISKLQYCFGPDTADLSIRLGIHSGPVTASILRGDGAKFRLCGETVNVASTMERTGVQDKIHVSRATAELLTAAGKGGWLSSREDRPLCGNNVNATYWLTKPIKQPKQKKVDYNFSTDTRYDDVELQVTENSDPSDLASWTLELLGSQLRNMTSAQAAFRGESGDQEKDDTVSFDMKGIVLHQLEALVKRIDATYVEQTTNVYDVCVALSAVDDFLQKGSKEQPCSEGNTCALATIALIFAAFVHDIIDNSARKEKETKGEHYVTFSSFKLWDALMSDDCDKVRLFFFVDAVQQSRFFAVIVFAVSRFQKDPSVVPLIDMKIDSQTDDTENSTDDSINDHLVAMEGAEQVAFVSATVTEAKAIPCEDSMHSSDVVCKDDVENMSEERGKETQDCHEGDGKDQLMAKGFTNTSAEEEHGQLEHDDRSIAYETSTRSVNL